MLVMARLAGPVSGDRSSLSAASSRRARRSAAARDGAAGEQRLDPGGRPDRGLGGERVEAALGDRQGALISLADPRRLVEPALVARRVRRPAIRSISRSASRSCASWRPGSAPGGGAAGGA